MSTQMYDPFPEDPRLQPAAALAFFVERRRARLHLTVEAAARLTGIEISRWMALESGWMPEDRLDIRVIAAVLEVPEEDLPVLRRHAPPPAGQLADLLISR